MKIIALEAENVKHLRVVNIKPDGSMIVIGGDNSAGKSCVLDSIEYALNGAASIPEMPIRAGQKMARVVLDLGEIQVTRTFTKKGTNLTVKSKDGATFSSPQSMLNELLGELAFDPLEFSKMDAKRQAEVLKRLVGLNFDKVNAQYKKTFDQRTTVNRQGKELKANIGSMVRYEGMPDTEVSINKLNTEFREALFRNQEFKRLTDTLSVEEAELEQLKKRAAVLVKDIKKNRKDLQGMKEIDTEAISSKISNVETINSKIRQNKRYDEINQDLIKLREQSTSLGRQLAKIETDKEKTLAKAKFPINGLAIDDDGVVFKGIPFTQCSSSQQIKISVAMGLAMNPKLRVILIREGSLLDEKNLAMVAKMAEKADAQIWVEKVSKGPECTVILEEGSVVESGMSNA